MSQCANILDWLQRGNTLTPAEAYERFGTLALHSRVAELRTRGFPIDCTLITLPSGKTVGQYRFAGQMRLCA